MRSRKKVVKNIWMKIKNNFVLYEVKICFVAMHCKILCFWSLWPLYWEFVMKIYPWKLKNNRFLFNLQVCNEITDLFELSVQLDTKWNILPLCTFSQQWITWTRCTISLYELVHSCIMGTGTDNTLGRVLNAPSLVYYQCQFP